MRKGFLIILALFFGLYSSMLSGQDSIHTVKKDSIKNLTLNKFPVAFLLPGTGFGFGALGLATYRFKGETIESRPSSTQFSVSYTTKNQLLIFAPYELYWDDEKWRLVGELGFFKFSYNFYGVGIDSREEDLDIYDVTFPRFKVSALREIAPNISVGLGYQLDIYYNLSFTEGEILDTSDVIGKDDGGNVSNIGFQAFYDSRDNIFLPTKGFFIQASAFTSTEFLGSSFTYSKFSLDSRYYQKIKGKHTLASNLFIANNGDGAPFFDLNWLGNNRTRGFDDRRFLDNAELSFATEYRFPIKGKIGGIAFGSTGTVADDFSSLFSSRYKNAGGLGLRYLINEKDGIRLRADYGVSSEGGILYLTIREAF